MQTFTPMQYLKIDIASSFGLDKESWDARIGWFDEWERKMGIELLQDEAEEPALFHAGVKAYRQAQNGQSIGYPISLDATASGAQILSALIGCRQSARLCNVVDTGLREDLYTNIHEFMCDSLGQDIDLERKVVKQAVMTSLYGSTAEPVKAFGEGEKLDTFYQVMNDEAPGIWALNNALLELWNSNTTVHEWILPDGFEAKIKVMDEVMHEASFLDMPVSVFKRENIPMESSPSLGANIVHSIDGMIVREIMRRCSYNRSQVTKLMELILAVQNGTHVALYSPETADLAHTSEAQAEKVRSMVERYKSSGFLSARIFDYIDEYSVLALSIDTLEAVWELLVSLPENPFPVLSVHDCFRVHPNYGNDLRTQYNNILADIAGSTMLDDIASQIEGEDVTVTKFDPMMHRDVRQANYALS